MTKKSTEEPKKAKQAKKKSELDELREQIESLEQEKGEIFAKLQRVSADYANFQKRVPKQISDTTLYEKERVIKTLLPAFDNFEHMLAGVRSAESVDVLIEGIEIVYSQMLDILKSQGVEQIEALGEKFDPSLHQAMLQRSEPEKEDNIVLEEFQKGYKLNDRVIRPSRVVVNKLASEEDQQPDEGGEPQLQEEEDLQGHDTGEDERAETE